jgi:hypothetical protein
VSNMKVGDKVWVQATVLEFDNEGARLITEVYGQRFWAANKEFRIESEMLDANEPVSNHCQGFVCNLAQSTSVTCPHDSCDIETGARNLVIKKSLTTELKVGDLVELRGRNRYNGARGILTQRNPDNGWFWFEACDPTNRHISGWREETWEDEEYGTFRLVKVD